MNKTIVGHSQTQILELEKIISYQNNIYYKNNRNSSSPLKISWKRHQFRNTCSEQDYEINIIDLNIIFTDYNFASFQTLSFFPLQISLSLSLSLALSLSHTHTHTHPHTHLRAHTHTYTFFISVSWVWFKLQKYNLHWPLSVTVMIEDDTSSNLGLEYFHFSSLEKDMSK